MGTDPKLYRDRPPSCLVFDVPLRLRPRLDHRAGPRPATRHAAAAGCDVIRAEKASGTRRDGQTELQVLLDFLRPGDALLVTRIDRLARSMKDDLLGKTPT